MGRQCDRVRPELRVYAGDIRSQRFRRVRLPAQCQELVVEDVNKDAGQVRVVPDPRLAPRNHRVGIREGIDRLMQTHPPTITPPRSKRPMFTALLDSRRAYRSTNDRDEPPAHFIVRKSAARERLAAPPRQGISDESSSTHHKSERHSFPAPWLDTSPGRPSE